MKHYVKDVVVILISFVLLYYSVAWAVLRCPHEEYKSSQKVTIHTDETSSNTLGYIPTTSIGLNVECGGPDYHTELMASSLSPSQFDPAAEIPSHVIGILTLKTVSGSEEGDLWLRAVFENPSAVPFLSGLPRYLSLTTFRV